MRRLGAVTVVCILWLTVSPAVADPLAEAVFERITERLEVMKSVAAWKRANGAAVEDRAREAVVLDRAGEDAARAGLEAETAAPFFEAQIEAAKDIQRCWIGRWNSGMPPDGPTPDIHNVIRPKLLAIGDAMLRDVKRALSSGVRFNSDNADWFAAIVQVDCLSPLLRDRLYVTLGGLRLRP